MSKLFPVRTFNWPLKILVYRRQTELPENGTVTAHLIDAGYVRNSAVDQSLYAVRFYGSMNFSLIHPRLRILHEEILFLAERDSLSAVKARVGEKSTPNCMTRRTTRRHKRTSRLV